MRDRQLVGDVPDARKTLLVSATLTHCSKAADAPAAWEWQRLGIYMYDNYQSCRHTNARVDESRAFVRER